MLLRRILGVPTSTSNEALYLETECLDIERIVKGMRLKFLHSLVNQEKNCMLYKFFIAQWENPVTGDWVLQVKNDLSDFGLSHDLSSLEARSQNSFKDLVKKKAVEFAKEKLFAIH